MKDKISDYIRLKKLIEENKSHRISDFLYFCDLHLEFFKAPHPICYYKSLLVRKELGEKLTSEELYHLSHLKQKIGPLKVNDLVNYAKRVKDPDSKYTIISNLEFMYNELIEFFSENMGNESGIVEFLKLTRNNLAFSENNLDHRMGFHKDILTELYDCFKNFRKVDITLNENLSVILTERRFIHILAGHMERYKIPRRGLGADFDLIHWSQLVVLIEQIIKHMKNDLIKHFSIQNASNYDNDNIFFCGCKYGLHIDSKRQIKTFYPIPF